VFVGVCVCIYCVGMCVYVNACVYVWARVLRLHTLVSVDDTDDLPPSSPLPQTISTINPLYNEPTVLKKLLIW
jgi:hypothetical protein